MARHLGASRGQPAIACGSMGHRERYASVNAVCTDHPAHRSPLPGPKKKKAPEGAFNMLRLVRQAD
ncbi:hypothetical protein DIE23_02610 [Burkholderia sp. Bp9143]|nr:hypothetical protein DIE23_02610 [Burkholderia sp. Bp9143]